MPHLDVLQLYLACILSSLYFTFFITEGGFGDATKLDPRLQGYAILWVLASHLLFHPKRRDLVEIPQKWT